MTAPPPASAGLSAADPMALRQPRLQRRLVIPTCERSREDREQGWHHDQGCHMARQEEWDHLYNLIRQFDAMRATTPGGVPIAALLAQGARADSVTPSVPLEGSVIKAREQSVAALDKLAQNNAADYAPTLIAALAHIDLGWTRRGQGWTTEIAPDDHAAFVRHFDRAKVLLAQFDATVLQSPALAAAQCALLPATPATTAEAVTLYETLINMDPSAPVHMRAYGNHLLPRWFGSYDRLNLEARRIATQTHAHWGHGGYTWVFMDALLVDDRAYEMLDTDFFLDGIRDILTRRPEQHLANMFAAYLGVSTRTTPPKVGDKRQIERSRARLTAGFRWVLHDFLRELHPLLWAEAATRFSPEPTLPDRAALVRRGRATAFSRIAETFAHVMAEGKIVRFDPEGIVYSPGG